MNHVKLFKALANDTRLQILEWLKKPSEHFSSLASDKNCPDLNKTGVCVGLIQKKTGLSQSTISEYLAILQDAGLVTSIRIGQWTYYKRNKKTFIELAGFIAKER